MSLVCSRKKHLKTKILLLFFILFLIIIRNALFAQGEEDRDPFLSFSDKIILSQKAQDLSTLPYPIVVNGIIWTEKIPVAMLNNDIVQQGENWRDFRVYRIEKDKVILKWENRKFEIFLDSAEKNETQKN